jgi:hypothetical protein
VIAATHPGKEKEKTTKGILGTSSVMMTWSLSSRLRADAGIE